MALYRKKPVVIEAWQFLRNDARVADHPEFVSRALVNGTMWFQGGDDPYFTISTLEGEMRASSGDWIIQGVKGEIYPCKADIFAATYEAVA